MADRYFTWKRFQTLLIALAGGLLLSLLFLDMCYADVPSETMPGTTDHYSIKFSERYQFLIFSFVTFALTIVTIGYYKQRIMQIRLCILNSLLLLFYQIWLVVAFFQLHEAFTFTVASLFPLIALILLLTAATFIWKDEVRFMVANAMAQNNKRKK
ncbi:MAG: DUF4293 family protein [Bacteroidales bacterium]|nr:DUF4293 family protein [Bacteroidales bacterium]